MKACENVFGDRYNLHSVVEHDVKSSLKPFEQFLGNFVFIFFNVDFAIRLHLFKFWSNSLFYSPRRHFEIATAQTPHRGSR